MAKIHRRTILHRELYNTLQWPIWEINLKRVDICITDSMLKLTQHCKSTTKFFFNRVGQIFPAKAKVA